MKRVMSILLSVTMLISVACFTSEASAQSVRPGAYALGAKIKDFSFTTYDGQTVTLYEVLQEKKMALINIWASWCGPCRSEFPYMQEAYELYQEQVEVIALSCEPSDTAAVLSQFAAQYGLSFKIGRDPVNFLSALNLNSIPVSMVVDRFGTICFIGTGAQTSADAFTRLFDVYVEDDYTESVLLTDIPAARPEITAATDADVSTALEIEARNMDSANVWPMTVSVQDGRDVMVSSNKGYASSVSAVEATVQATAGEAIVVTFKTSTESVFDALRIYVNGELVKSFAGEHDWMSYAIPVTESGEHTVCITYQKDHVSDGGEDTVWVDSIAVAEDGMAAIAANPIYPVDSNVTFDVVSPSARQVTIEDPTGILYSIFGAAKYYVVNSDTVEVRATLTEAIDPEQAFMVSYYDGSYISLSQAAALDGYRMITGVDSIAESGYSCSYVMLYEDISVQEPLILINFRDEDNLNSFVSQNGLGAWHYVDKDEAPVLSMAYLPPAEATYTIKCIDDDGKPVEGVMLQICDESTCQVVTTGDDGVYIMTTEPYTWEVHILKAPSGYVADTANVQIMPLEGGEAIFVLEKE